MSLAEAKMLAAAFRSRSCSVSQVLQRQLLTPNALSPLGPFLSEQTKQVTVEKDSVTSRYVMPSLRLLQESIVLKSAQPASATDLAMFVFLSLELLTFPTTNTSYSLVSSVVCLWFQYLRLFLILA